MPINYIRKLYNNTDTFQSLVFDKDDITLNKSTQYTISIIKPINLYHNIPKLQHISEFLRNYFKKSINSPILDIHPNKLLDTNDTSFIITIEMDNIIIGTIRYKYIGNFAMTNNKIYSIDCFCIHPQWRKKGIGDMLLTTLHKYVNRNDIPYSIFLKEGAKLGIIHQPVYSGTYMYREITDTTSATDITSTYKIQPLFAHKVIKHFQTISNNNTFIIFNPNNTSNQEWYLYINPHNKLEKILVCFQDTYQYFSTDTNKTSHKIAWGTAWFETNITNETRQEAIKQFISCLYPRYKYVWMNKAWIDDTIEWKYDGDFHWYLYQWNTSITIKRNYGIIL